MQKFVKYAIILFGLLLIPFVGTLLSNEVNWSGFDYLIASIFLIIIFIGIEVINKYAAGKKIIWILILGLVMLLVWLELAVGIFDTPFAGS